MTSDCFDPELDPELDGGLVCEDHLDELLLDAFIRGAKTVLLISLPAVVTSLAVAARNHHRCNVLRRIT